MDEQRRITKVFQLLDGTTRVFDQNDVEMEDYRGPASEVFPAVRADGYRGEITDMAIPENKALFNYETGRPSSADT